jgi:hypothetical protein
MDNLSLEDILEMIEAYEYLLGHHSQMTYNDLAFMFDTSLNVVKAVMAGEHHLQTTGPRPKRPRKPRVEGPRKLKTHCKRGHEMSGDNLRIYDYDGLMKRQCKACQQEYRILKKNTTSKEHE